MGLREADTCTTTPRTGGYHDTVFTDIVRYYDGVGGIFVSRDRANRAIGRERAEHGCRAGCGGAAG